MTDSIRIKTSIQDSLIIQEVSDPSMEWWPLDQRLRLIARDVMNTKDAQVREALIRLGWTPPNGDVREGQILIDGIWNRVSAVYMEGDTSSLPPVDDRVIDALSSRDRLSLSQGAVVNVKAPDGSSKLFRFA